MPRMPPISWPRLQAMAIARCASRAVRHWNSGNPIANRALFGNSRVSRRNRCAMATAYAGLSSSNDIRAKAGVNDALLTVGRVIFAVLFILSGFAKITDLSATAAMIGSKGLPLPLVLAGATAALEL